MSGSGAFVSPPAPDGETLRREGRLPTFVGVGAAKSGTTSLHAYLRQHPEVFMSRIKETNFFASDIDPARFSPTFRLADRQRWLDVAAYVEGNQRTEHWDAYVRDPRHYRKLFRFAGPAVALGEISNSYLYSRVAAARIRERIPDARVLMMLRNPVDRAYSHYLANVRDGLTTRAFAEEVDRDRRQVRTGWGISHLYVELGLYHEQVRRYVDRFDATRLKILIYDDFVRDPAGTMADVFAFVGVDPSFRVDMTRRHNAARMPRLPRLMHALTRTGLKRPLFYLLPGRMRPAVKDRFFRRDAPPRLPASDRRALAELFRDDVGRLSDLLGRDLSSWLTGPDPAPRAGAG